MNAASAISIQPISALRGYVILPGSKSMTNRIVLLAALSEGISGIENVLVSRHSYIIIITVLEVAKRVPKNPCLEICVNAAESLDLA